MFVIGSSINNMCNSEEKSYCIVYSNYINGTTGGTNNYVDWEC